MRFSDLLRRRKAGSQMAGAAGARPCPRRTCPPRLEALEGRLAPAVFNVNSLADISIAGGVNPDGSIVGLGHTITLRSAIQAANANSGAGGNTISLTLPGTYRITQPGTAGETDNLRGEFSIFPTTPNGDLTIVNASGGAVTVDGGGTNRVFDVNAGDTNDPATHFLVTLRGFTITNGNASPGDLAPGAGGGIRVQGNQSLTLTDMVITRNNATADGGGIVMENAVNSSWTLTINNSTISDNHAGDAGGGIDTDGAGTIFINPGTVITGNTDLNQGAGIYVDSIQVGATFVGASMTMTGAVVSNNQALAAGALGPPAGGGSGGGISNAGNGTITITGSTVANNSAGGAGGGFSDENGQGTLVVANSLFVGNTAAGDGGGIQEGGPSTTITDTVFRGNSSGGAGGGLFANGTRLTVAGSTFAGNTARTGGGIEIATTGLGSTITNSTIAGNGALNNAGANGGGIDAPAAFTGSLVLLNDTVTANFAGNGGGIFWAGAGGSTFRLQNTVVARNTAGTAGPDADNPAGNFTDPGGNLIGVSGAGGGNTGFNAYTTQTGTVAAPLDPRLGPLTPNGGPTVGAAGAPGPLLTEVPLAGSPLIGRGVAAGAPAGDERGYPRPAAGSGKPAVGAVEFLTAQEGFVQAVYLDELGRPGSKAELDGWVGALNGPAGQQGVASAILHSAEARDRLVKGWYVSFLGRQATGGEEMGFVNLLLAGQAEEQVLSVLLSSSEFFNHAQTLVPSGTPRQRVVTALYQLLLGRTPSPAELNAQVNGLAALGQQGLALAFLRSAEYRGDVVGGDYVNLLHRAADPAGANGWVSSGMDLGSIRLGFEASAEFFSNG